MSRNTQNEIIFQIPKSAYPPRHRGVYRMSSLFIALLAFGYIAFQASAIFITPELLVRSPIDGAQIHSDSVAVQGSTQESVLLTVNGYETYSNDKGEFDLSLPMQKGFHTLDIRVKNRIGKESRVVRHIVVE